MGKHFLAEWKLKLSDMSIYAGIIAVLFVAGIGTVSYTHLTLPTIA